MRMLPEALTDMMSSTFNTTLDGLYGVDGIEAIEHALITLASDPDVQTIAPTVTPCLEALTKATDISDEEEREYALIELYLALHGGGHDYNPDETTLLESRRGLRCLPGGLLPLLLARHLVQPDTVFADLGSGNGLQGLLLRRLCPHRKTIQVELSKSMIEVGKHYQNVLNIEEHSVVWINDDITRTDLSDITLLYLYRPARPVDEGNSIYRILSENISHIRRPLTIVSVADCFGKFLDNRFSELYGNEFVTVYSSDQSAR